MTMTPLLGTRLPLKLKTKRMRSLLASTAVASTIIYIYWSLSTSSHIARGPKTFLTHNNEHLCSSNVFLNNGQNHHLVRSIDATIPFKVSIIIVVPSLWKNFMQRNLIRQTYGVTRTMNNVHILGVVFMLGTATDPNDSAADLDKLSAEKIRFGDVIVGDVVDSYRNLSRKSIMAYNWLTSYCHEADLVVKTDDDVVVDIFKLTAELGTWTPTELRSLKFWCGVHSAEKIIRDPESMYHVSSKEYAHKEFPQHCAGVGYVTSMRLVRLIADEISKSFVGPICTHEDVLLTGIVPENINSAGNKQSIEHVDKMMDWVLYVDEHSPEKGGTYIWNVVGEAIDKTVDYDEFRKQSGKRVFYLLQHGPSFESKFLRLWYLVENSFRNGTGHDES